MPGHTEGSDTDAVTPWRAGERTELARTRILTLHEQRYECVDHPERSGDFTVIECADWVNVVALTRDTGRGPGLVLIEQFRYGTAENTLEVPGGIIDQGEDPVEAGERELLEETGYAGENARLLGRMDANPAILTNRVHTVLIESCSRVREPRLDPHEQIVVREVPWRDVPGMISSQSITHTVVVAALFRATIELGR
jgi:ADP-ribose pyrophosphatase